MSAPLNFDQIVATAAVQGPPGAPGPPAGTFANAAALAAFPTAGLSTNPIMYVTSLNQYFGLFPSSSATPDNANIIAASGGGNWLSLFFVSQPFGTGVVGTGNGAVTVAETPSITGIVTVSAGQSAIVWTLPQPAMAFLETLEFSIRLYFQNPTLGSTDFGHAVINGAIRNKNGTFAGENGTSGWVDVTLPAPPTNFDASLVGTLYSLVATASNSTVGVSVTAPGGTAVVVSYEVSYNRRPQPGAGPAPVVTNCTVITGPSTGGTSGTVTGLHLSGGNVVLDGVVATTTTISDAQLNFVSGVGPALGGTGSIAVTTSTGTGVDQTQNWTYFATPASIFGANLIGWWRNDSLQQTAGTFTSWTDKSGNGNTLTITGTTPTYNASSANITPNGPSLTFNGSSDAIAHAALALAPSGNPPLFLFVVYRAISTGAVVDYSINHLGLVINAFGVGAGKPVEISIQSPAVWGASTIGSMVGVVGYTDGAAGGSNLAYVEVSNGSPVNTIGAGGLNNTFSGTLTIGSNGSTFGGFEVVDIVVANVFQPAANIRTALQGYKIGTFGGT